MTTLHVTLTKVTGLWLLLPLLVEGKRLAAAENDGSEVCVQGEEGATCIFDKDLCGWRSETWEARKRLNFAKFDTDKFHHGVLQSPLICSTEWSVHCLSFDYQFNHHYSDIVMLTVGLDVEGRGNVSVWQLKGNTGGIYVAKAPVQTTADFRILFQVDKPQNHDPVAGSYVIVTNIIYEETKCSVNPSNAAVRKPAVTSKAPTTGTARPCISRSSIIVSTQPDTDLGDPRTQGTYDMTSNAVVIPSVVAAVAVTALVVVVVVFVWWRRAVLSRLERAQRGRMEMAYVASTRHSTRARDADTNDENDSYDDIAPSHYDVPGELSTNPYSSLKMTGHRDVIATSATPRCVIL
ncbi:uncharacterized protein LOC143301222 [Babylonia areolata]|uniref:uncharacterized protein LOC143301222 n=1 Tax=Babylonia areolata TaxID=304850 RepID=UPI003FD62058